MGLTRINRNLKKQFGGRVTAAFEDGCVVLRGELDKWTDVVSSCQTAAVKYSITHVVNDIRCAEDTKPPMRVPSVQDASLDGARRRDRKRAHQPRHGVSEAGDQRGGRLCRDRRRHGGRLVFSIHPRRGTNSILDQKAGVYMHTIAPIKGASIHGKSCKTGAFRKELPAQYLNVGIAEQNCAGVAAGLATCGKIPIVVTYAAFGSMRMCEMIRQEAAYPHLNVKLACSHGGVTPANDGASHQAIEDMGIYRTIPNMTVIMPADYYATRRLVQGEPELPLVDSLPRYAKLRKVRAE